MASSQPFRGIIGIESAFEKEGCRWHLSPAPVSPRHNGHRRLGESWNHEHDLRSNWLLWDVPPLQDNNVNHRNRWDHHCDGDGCKCLIHAINAMPITDCCMSCRLHCSV